MNIDFQATSIQIANAIKSSQKILMHCHTNVDPDSICSVLAMAHYLKSINKDVKLIIGDSKYPEGLKTLPNYEWFKMVNYTQINPDDFDLFIILDTSAPTQITKLTEVKFPDNMTTVVIDHHISNKNFGNINLVIPNYSSTSEIIYDLFKIWNVELTKEIAICLYIGVYYDTGAFKYQNTTADTLFKAAELGKINPDYKKVIFSFENSVSPQDIIYKSIAYSSIKKFFSDNFAVAVVSLKDLEKHGIYENDFFCSIADTLRTVVGWNICASVDEIEPNKIAIGLRTRDENKYDVSLIAKSIGTGGGGHKGAAGTTIEAPLKDALKMLVDKVGELYFSEQ